MQIDNWTSVERFEHTQQAKKNLKEIKRNRKNRKYQMIRVDKNTWIEKEVKN